MSGRASRSSDNIDVLRARIGAVDDELGHLLARRSHLVRQIQGLKALLGWPHADGAQEGVVIRRIVAAHRRHGGEYGQKEVEQIGQAVCDAHKSIAQTVRRAIDGGDSEGSGY